MFYKLDESGLLLFGPEVTTPEGVLLTEFKDAYTYPAFGGWYWFETEEEAKSFFNIQETENE